MTPPASASLQEPESSRAEGPIVLPDDPAPPADLGPIKPAERISEMDMLRGFALLGICVINLPGFFAPHALEASGAVELFPGRADKAAQWLVNFFGSGKFNSMFSILFGVGFAIQMERAASKSASFAGMYLRRLAALFLFGLAHVIFLWDGDVLHLYAAIGVPLIFARKLRDRWLWAIVALCLVAPIARAAVGAYLGEKPSRTHAQMYERGLDELRIYGRGEYVVPGFVEPKAAAGRPKPPPETVIGASTYPAVVADRTREWLRSYREGAAWFWPIMGTTLVIGFIAGRRRWFQDIPSRLPQVRRIALWSGVLGFLMAGAFATSALLTPPGEMKDSTLGMVAGISYILGRPVLCVFYMCTIVLLAQAPRWRSLMAPLASVGRMPLTNYLMQSVVASTLFYGYALGLYYRIGPAVGVAIAFATYAIQVVYSTWWMKRFRFGPAEWLWRTMTYGKAPAMRLAEA